MDHGKTETDKLLRDLCLKARICRKDVRCIRLYAQKQQDPQQWRSFFETVQIRQEPYAFHYMLSRLGAKFRWDLVPESCMPVLRGLYRKKGMENILLLNDALPLMRKLQEAGIPMLAVKGAALRTGLLPGISRMMSDVDLVVPEERYAESVRIAAETGLDTSGHAMHAADIRKDGRGCVDIHYRLFKSNIQKKEQDCFRSDMVKTVARGGISWYVSSPEIVFLHLLVNGLENILYGSHKSPLIWMADCVDLAEAFPLSYKTIAKKAEEFQVIPQFRAAVMLLRKFLPDSFPGLYGETDGGISRRAVRRMQAVLHTEKLTKEEQYRLSPVQRAVYLFRVSKREYAGLYHPDDPAFILLAGTPDLLKKWVRAGRYTEIPKELREILMKWKKQREGV